MTTFLEYQDVHVLDNVKKAKLPFYMSRNVIGSYIRLHHHDFAEISFVYEGRGTETVNKVKHIMQPGTASFLLPHHIHSIHSEIGTPLRLFCCMFDINILYGSPIDLEWIRQLLSTGKDFPSYVDFNPQQAQLLTQIFTDMLQEYRHGEFGSASFIRIKLIEVLLMFSRAQRAAAQCAGTLPSKGSRNKIWDMILHLHLHYPEKITLEDLAVRFKVTPSYISHSFKKLCGQNFLDYLHSLRVNYALSMLATTDMAVVDISVETGFDSFRSFSRVFKKMQGMTPSQYREIQRQLPARSAE